MANVGAEYVDLEETNISSVVKIQALFRGALVRKWFKELKNVYMTAVSEIQKDDAVDVIWKTTLCKPQVLRKSQRRKIKGSTSSPRSGNTDTVHTNVNHTQNVTERKILPPSMSPTNLSNNSTDSPRSCDSPNIIVLDSRIPKSIHIQTEEMFVTETEDKESMVCSVETQTSLIEVKQDRKNDSAECLFPEYDNNKIDSNQNDKMEQISNDIQAQVKDKQPDFKVNLDSYKSESDTDSETKNKLLDETGGWQLSTEDKALIKDVDQVSDKSESPSERSMGSRKSHQSTERSTSQNTREPVSKQETDVVHVKDTKIHSASPSAIPNRKSSGRETSPVPKQKVTDKQRYTSQDSTALTNVTSVWDSVNSFRDSQADHSFQIPSTLPTDPEQLYSLRKNIAMELLWVQQAINSRKNYLRLKQQM